MGLLSYPTTYACIGHFWSDEIHRAEENGFACAPGPGWGWFGTSDVLAAGAERLWELREGARFDRYRDLPWRVAIEDNIKRAAVEAIGLWAVSDELVKLGGSDGEEYIDEIAGRTGILESRERSSGSLLHLASWVFMRCRCALYDAALPAARRGALVATNFDEIYTTAEPDWLETGTGLGQWKVRKLTNAQAPKPRWIDSDQKTRHPGEAHATI